MSRSQQPMIPLQGLFSLVADLARYNGKPLTFPKEWKNDYLGVFFTTMVEKGFAVWLEPKEEECQESSTPSSESTSSSPLIVSP